MEKRMRETQEEDYDSDQGSLIALANTPFHEIDWSLVESEEENGKEEVIDLTKEEDEKYRRGGEPYGVIVSVPGKKITSMERIKKEWRKNRKRKNLYEWAKNYRVKY